MSINQQLKKYNTTTGLIETHPALDTNESNELSSSSSSSSKSPVVLVVDKTSTVVTRSATRGDDNTSPSSRAPVTDSSATTSSSSISKQFTPPSNSAVSQQRLIDELVGDEANLAGAAPPKEIKARLYRIFAQIESEFDALYRENDLLRQQLFLLNNNG